MTATAKTPENTNQESTSNRGRRPVDPNESKADKFRRLATARVNMSLDAIAKLEGLAVPSLYDYNDEQVSAILKALEGAVVKVANRFKNPSAKAQTGFTL